MTATVETITPHQAEKWLKMLPSGMRINRGSVKIYLDLLKSKRWVPTHQGVVLDQQGQLLSGGEILVAIAESGLWAEVKVSRGEDSATLPLYGRGRPRNARDVLKAVCKVSAPGPEAQVLSSFVTHALRGNSSNPLQVESTHIAFQAAINEVAFAKVPVGVSAFWRNAAKAAAALALAGKGHRESIREFISELFDRRDASRATLAFRRRLNESIQHLTARQVFDQTLCAIAAHCNITPADDAESVRTYFLTNAEANHLRHDTAA